MPSRRPLLLSGAFATVPLTLTACSSSDNEQSAARALRAPLAKSSGAAASLMHDLVLQAVLAPSSHSTQCWRFQIAEKSISIAPDLTCRCQAVDPEDHHIFVSLGCATETEFRQWEVRERTLCAAGSQFSRRRSLCFRAQRQVALGRYGELSIATH